MKGLINTAIVKVDKLMEFSTCVSTEHQEYLDTLFNDKDFKAAITSITAYAEQRRMNKARESV